MLNEIRLRPIGYVEEGLPEEPQTAKRGLISTIRIYDEFVEGLAGLEEYSHVFVIWYMHKVGEVKLKIRPRRLPEGPEVGIFATRFPPRPNPIGLSIAEIISVEPPRLRVRNLDAWTGSPVLDIKPYDILDVVERPKMPEWLKRLLNI
ncbi:MAG: tRNA (N6-threonylcarbamoyladenosine(37)-N6)-methyltransferase TrmO [Thermoproteus sp.]